MSEYPKVSKSRLGEIAALAEFIASENNASGFTDVEALVRRKRITMSHSNYGDAFCGLIECDKGRFHIYCNEDRVGRRDSGRGRFTIAHELGHFFVDDHRCCLMNGGALHGSNIDYHPRNPVEQEADCFASNLLMPEAMFRSAAKRPSGLGTIMTLKDRFGTSIMATALRYCELEIEPVAIIHWSPDGYGWKRLSRSFRSANCRKTIESIDQLDDGSATQQVLQGVEPGQPGFFQTTSLVSRWFPYANHGAENDAMLCESAIRLGRFGFLTVLSLRPGEQLPNWATS